MYRYDTVNPYTYDVYKEFTRHGAAASIPGGANFDIVVVDSGLNGAEYAGDDFDAFIRGLADYDANIIAKGKIDSNGKTIGTYYNVTLSFRTDLTNYRYGPFYVLEKEKQGPANGWTYDPTIIPVYVAPLTEGGGIALNAGQDLEGWRTIEIEDGDDVREISAIVFTNDFYSSSNNPVNYRYTVVHQYYTVNGASRVMDGSTSASFTVPAGTSVDPATIGRVYVYDGATYGFISVTPSVITTIAADGSTVFTLVYERTEGVQPPPPVVDIGEGDTPLTDFPPPEPDAIIDPDEVPLADLPQTGVPTYYSTLFTIGVLLAAAGIAFTYILRFKKQRNAQ
jgi:hypothetical protein